MAQGWGVFPDVLRSGPWRASDPISSLLLPLRGMLSPSPGQFSRTEFQSLLVEHCLVPVCSTWLETGAFSIRACVRAMPEL